MKKLSLLILALSFFSLGCSSDNVAPRILSTFPVNGSMDVDPSITEITVTFNEEMMDNHWSWTQGSEDNFPTITASIYYTDNLTKNVLPVKLEPNKEYIIGINSKNHKNFKDKSGNPVNPFVLKFKTR